MVAAAGVIYSHRQAKNTSPQTSTRVALKTKTKKIKKEIAKKWNGIESTLITYGI